MYQSGINKFKRELVLFIPLFLFLGIFCPVKAQQEISDRANGKVSYLNISSNFDSLYVYLKSDTTLSKVSKNDLMKVEPIEQQVILIPRYAPTISFHNDFEADSIYAVNVQYGFILDEENNIYQQIESGEVDFDEIKAGSIEKGFFNIVTYNQNQYTERKQVEKVEYKNSFLKVFTNTDSVYVRSMHPFNSIVKIASGDSINFKPGKRVVVLAHPYAETLKTKEVIEAGKTTTVKYRFNLQKPSVETLSDNLATEPHYNSNLVIISDDDSEIFVEDKYMGNGAVHLDYRTGPVNITIRNPNTGTKNYLRKITNLPLDNAVVVDAYSKPVKKYAQLYGFIPGMSQWYKNQSLKSSLIAGSFLAFSSITLLKNSEYNDELLEYYSIENNYNNAITEENALALGNKLETQYERVDHLNVQRKLFLGLTSLVYVYNLYDALFDVPKFGFRKNTNIEFYFQQNSLTDQPFTSMTLKYAF